MFGYRNAINIRMQTINKYMNTLTQVKNNFEGHNYIVVGSPKGIGFSIAKYLTANGAKVTLVGKHVNTRPNVFTAADEINEIVKKPSCMPVLCDINMPNQVQHVINETLDVHGSINGVVLMSEVAILKDSKQLYSMDLKHMNTNINGTYLFGQHILQHIFSYTL